MRNTLCPKLHAGWGWVKKSQQCQQCQPATVLLLVNRLYVYTMYILVILYTDLVTRNVNNTLCDDDIIGYADGCWYRDTGSTRSETNRTSVRGECCCWLAAGSQTDYMYEYHVLALFTRILGYLPAPRAEEWVSNWCRRKSCYVIARDLHYRKIIHRYSESTFLIKHCMVHHLKVCMT